MRVTRRGAQHAGRISGAVVLAPLDAGHEELVEEVTPVAEEPQLSFRINAEINIGYSEPALVEELLERLFYPDFETAVELTEPFPADGRHFIAEVFADRL